MPTRVDLPKEIVRTALELAYNSARRGYNTAKNPQFKELHEKEVNQWRVAMETIQEVK